MSFKRTNLYSGALIALFFFLLPLSAVSQEHRDRFADMQYAFGYFGNNLWNPGVSVAAGLQVWNNSIEPGEGLPQKSLLVSTRAATYLDPGSHGAVFINGGIAYQRTGRGNLTLGADFLPAGIYRSFLPETYRFDEGSFRKVVLPGNFYFSPSLGISLGHYTDPGWVPGWYGRFSVTLLNGYNFYLMPLIGIEAGILIRTGGGKR